MKCINSKQLHNLGFKYNWINRHFKHLKISNMGKVNVYVISDILKYSKAMLLQCYKSKNIKQNHRSEKLFEKLIKELKNDE